MQSINIHRGKAFFIGVILCALLWGGWWFVSKQVYYSFQAILHSFDVVKISVYSLWMPLGFLGIGLIVVIGTFVSCITGIKANYVWGALGYKAVNYIVGVFAFLGVVAAIGAYKWMTNQLDEQGYLYCQPLTRISVMGRYEVYVARPELCVNPLKPE
ncbi:MAG: hypothetical protein ACRCWP_03175 [Shewanella sp.]